MKSVKGKGRWSRMVEYLALSYSVAVIAASVVVFFLIAKS